MRREKIAEVLDSIDDAFVAEAAVPSFDEKGAKPRPAACRLSPWRLAPACLVLLLLLGSTAFAIASEAKEYRKAVEFFEENGLSAEGLSRAEVKEVYRDIETRRFSEDKTAEVLRRTVTGREILREEPTPEELAALWDGNRQSSGCGIVYHREESYVFDPGKGFEVFEKCVLECSADGRILWTAEFRDFTAEDALHTPAGTAVWGWNPTSGYGEKTHGWLARVDDDGNVLWERKLDHGFEYEHIAAVLDDGDGTWAVFSRGGPDCLCFSRYDRSGNELSFRKTEVGNLGVRNAVRLGDGYVVQLWNSTTMDTALLVKVDREGNVLGRIAYEGADCDYYLTDMIEYGGRIWLSASAVPKQTDEGGRHEIANVLDHIFSQEDWDISDEELTALLRENYTAVLLLCGQEGGEPETFYSVKGALGGRLSVNDAGQLAWDTESFVSSFFSPATSSFSVGGTCRVVRCTFDEKGYLLGQEDTGETTQYRR